MALEVCGAPGCSRRIDVRYYQSMQYRTGAHSRSIPVVPGWYVEIADGGSVTAYGPYGSADQALAAARTEFSRIGASGALIVGDQLIQRQA